MGGGDVDKSEELLRRWRLPLPVLHGERVRVRDGAETTELGAAPRLPAGIVVRAFVIRKARQSVFRGLRPPYLPP
jgi:hypothetical protein